MQRSNLLTTIIPFPWEETKLLGCPLGLVHLPVPVMAMPTSPSLTRYDCLTGSIMKQQTSSRLGTRRLKPFRAQKETKFLLRIELKNE